MSSNNKYTEEMKLLTVVLAAQGYNKRLICEELKERGRPSATPGRTHSLMVHLGAAEPSKHKGKRGKEGATHYKSKDYQEYRPIYLKLKELYRKGTLAKLNVVYTMQLIRDVESLSVEVATLSAKLVELASVPTYGPSQSCINACKSYHQFG